MSRYIIRLNSVSWMCFSLFYLSLLSVDAQEGGSVLVGGSNFEGFYSVSSQYYKSLESKKLEEKVVTLNDLGEVCVDPGDEEDKSQLPTSKEGVRVRALEKNSRWGRAKPQLALLYRVVDFEEIKGIFSRLFGKELSHWQVVVATYTRNEGKAKVVSESDPSGAFDLDAFSKLDLWLLDEDGKWYVLLGYRPCLKLNQNISMAAAKRLGISPEKLLNISTKGNGR